MPQRPPINLHLVLTIFFGIGMVLFGILAILAYRDNEYINNNLKQLNAKAAQEAAANQKEADAKANQLANENPYRPYIADQVHGGFQLQFPKNWSISATKATTGVTRLELLSNPDLINVNVGSKAINTHAFKLKLVTQSPTDVVKTYQDKVKKKQVTAKMVRVSGISGTWLEGAIDDQRHTGVVVVFQVRDKTMIMSTDDMQYIDQFNKILETASIVP